MPPKCKVTARSAKKGKAVRTKLAAVVQSDNEVDWASKEEEPSMQHVV